MAVLVTGAAGFIGAATARALLERGDEVVGIDNLNDYYDPALKQARLDNLARQFGNRFRFERVDFADAEALKRVDRRASSSTASSISARRPAFATASRTRSAYVQSNLVGHCNMLELARRAAAAAHGLCLVVVGLRRQQEPAVPGRGPGRSSAVALCRDQEGRRAAQRKLCQPLSAAADGPALLHGLRAVGPARHGDVDLHQGAVRRRAAAAVQRRRDAARLHLHRRYRARRRRLPRRPARRRRRDQGRRKHQPARASTISATAAAKI